MFYLQDSRGYVGNEVLWWAKNGHGYTTDLTKAHVYTEAEALSQQRCRSTDIPWPKAYIDAKSRPCVDHQSINRSDAYRQMKRDQSMHGQEKEAATKETVQDQIPVEKADGESEGQSPAGD